MASEYATWDILFMVCDRDRLSARGFIDSHGQHDSDEALDELSARIRAVLTEWHNRVGKHVLDCAPTFNLVEIEET